MKQISIFVFAVVFLMFALCVSGQNVGRSESGNYFEVEFEQDGKAIPISDHQVILKKKAFMVVLYFQQPNKVLVNASVAPESFEAARSGKPLQEIRGFTDLGMAEEAFNPKAVLMLSSQAPHFWYYANDANHRFNEIVRKNGGILCKRIVANVMYRDTTKQYVPIRDIPEDALYLVFMRTEWTKDFSRQLEKQREYVKVVFQ